MFSEPRVNVIESDEGFSVEVLGRTGLLYVEGDRKMRVDSEVLTRTRIAVIKGSINRWDVPFENETIDDDKREKIFDNIVRAFNFTETIIDVW